MANIISLINDLKSKLIKIYNQIITKISDKKKTISFFTDVFLFIVLLFNSGYAFTNSNSTLAILLLLFGIIVLICSYILTINYKEFIFKIKSFKWSLKNVWKRICTLDLCTIAFGVTIFASLLTIIVNKDLGSVGSYIWNIGTIIFSFAFTKKYTFKKFVNIFEKSLVFFSIIAIVLYIIRLIVGFPYSILSFISDNGVTYSNYFFLAFDYPEGFESVRMISVFWEPGLYSTFLCFALLIEIAYKEKMNYWYCLLFVVCVLLSRSSFGYLALIFLIFAFATRVFKKSIPAKVGIAIILVGCVLGAVFLIEPLAQIMPRWFGKLVDPLKTSMRDRIYSPQVNLLIAKENLIFGVGLSKHAAQYSLYGITQTSTTTKNIACFGVVSILLPCLFIISCFVSNKLDKFIGAYVVIIFMLMINKEPHNVISTTHILMFYVIEMLCDERYEVREIDYEHNILSKFLNGNNGILVRNTGASFVIKGVAMVFSLFSLPVYIKYFRNDSVLGVWLTVLSIINFLMMFDFGLGNGLKNKLIDAIAKDDKERIKKLISSSYFSIGLICLGLIVIGIPSIIILTKYNVLDLFSIFGVRQGTVTSKALLLTVIIVYTSIVLELFLKLISSILHALQKQAITSTFSLITNIVLILFAGSTHLIGYDNRIITLAVVYFAAVNIPLIIASIVLFATNPILKDAKFSIGYVEKTAIKDVVQLGLKFFIIQLCLLVINSTNEIIISSFLNDSSLVVLYNKYFKLFSVVITVTSLITGPVWGAISKAFFNGDFKWVKKINKLMLIIGAVFTVGTLMLVGVLQIALNVWLDEETITVNYLIALAFGAFTIVQVFIYLLTSVSNGIQALKTQLIGLCAAAILKIPLFILLNKTNLFINNQWVNVMIANTIVLLPIMLIQPLENYIVLKKAERSALNYEKTV